MVITKWGARFMVEEYPCAIGRGGIGEKQGEGDGITPKGIFRLLEVRYRPDRIDLGQLTIDSVPILPGDIWSDDPKDPNYNHPAKSFSYPFSHEKMRRSDPLYDAVGILDFNYPDTEPGKGSAIFLHIWRKPGHPTEGCVAFARHDFFDILQHWKASSRVIIK